MEFTGRFVGGLRIDVETRRMEFTIQSEKDIGKDWDNLRKKDRLEIAVKPYREKRSLDANGYYWTLLTELANQMRISKPHMHNLLLRRYGQPEIIDGKMIYLVLPDSDSGTRVAEEAESYHIRPTAQVKTGSDGKIYRTYIMLRGSSTYDTREMSILIDGLISECKECGIETLPSEELSRMMQAYEKSWQRRQEREGRT